MQDVRIALVSCRCPFNQLEDNLARTARWTQAAVRQGAAMVCFPELNLSGYHVRQDAAAAAQEIPGPATDALCAICRREKTVLLAGLIERDSGGRLFATHVVAQPGKAVETFRKLHIAPPEKGIYCPGSRVPLFRACGLVFGIQLCYDAHFPELTTCMALMGADIVFIPHASPRGTAVRKLRSWRRHLPARAYDNSLYVMACNQAGDNDAGLAFPGLSLAVDPRGEVMAARMSSACSAMLVVDLKAEDLAAVRSHSMRYFLPHRRPEVYANTDWPMPSAE